MRGEVAKSLKSRKAHRITPAHAGRSQFLYGCTTPFQDHPRACGEKAEKADFENRKEGSPPRMRGEVPTIANNDRAHGITPAHAGRRWNQK